MQDSDSNSPIVGALTLNYLSYGLLTAVNNLWSWLTVFAASFGCWKVRALSSPPPKPEEREGREESPSVAEPAADSKKHLVSSLCDGGTPKVKFSLYFVEAECEYSGNGEREEEAEEEEEECNGRTRTAKEVIEKVEGWCEGGGDWERRMVVRMGDMGWYTCQDLRVLNGSVVRLWKTPSPRRRRGVV